MNEGKKFENSFKASVPPNVYYFRIKDSASSFSQDSSSAIRFTPKNPYDQFLYQIPNLFPMELKSTIGTSISSQFTKEEKGKMIKLHQIEGLTYANSFDGINAGFIFDFRKSGITYWLNIADFNRFLNDTNKKSINENDIMQFNGLTIDKKLKKVNYTYDIAKLINDIVTKI
jgi:recombination protein U